MHFKNKSQVCVFFQFHKNNIQENVGDNINLLVLKTFKTCMFTNLVKRNLIARQKRNFGKYYLNLF